MPDLSQIIVLLVLGFIIFSLYREIVRPAATFFIAIVILSATGILTPSQALSGFANEQIAVITLLLVLASIIKKTNVIDAIFDRFFKGAKTYSGFISRLMFYVAGSSAFLNNTPIVATLIPYVNDWGKRNNIAPSKLLIPLSYAAILGGTATLIGTSTNLLINGMATDNGLQPFAIFDFAYVGAPLIVVGIAYLLLFGYRLLPDKKDVLENFTEKSREYIVETRIKANSPLIGRSIEDADLRHLKTLFLVEILRDNLKIAPVSPGQVLMEGDILIFAGEVDSISELLNSEVGLELPQVNNIVSNNKLKVNEAVVPQNSFLIGKKLRETNFRAIYDAAIIAIHRNGERLSGKIGEIRLKPGDLLMLVTGEDFKQRTKDTQNIYVISNIKELQDINLKKVNTIGFGTLLAIGISAAGFLSLFKALLILLSIITLMRIISLDEIKNNLDFNVIIILGFAIGISKALITTGTSDLMATSFLAIFEPLGAIGILFGIYITTNLLTEFVTNAAAASIVFPVALATAQTMGEGVPTEPYILAVAYGASASFLTPIGYQTNLMVFGPGGYKVKDFTKVGLPLSLIYMLVCCLILGYRYGIY